MAKVRISKSKSLELISYILNIKQSNLYVDRLLYLFFIFFLFFSFWLLLRLAYERVNISKLLLQKPNDVDSPLFQVLLLVL